MKLSICLVLAFAVSAYCMGYGSQRSSGYGQQQSSGYGQQQSSGYGKQQSSGYGQQQSSGYGKQQSSGYGKQQSSGYGAQSGNVDYKLKYNIYLPEDNHGSSANWMVEQDPQTAHYTLDQTHPYGAKSNVYYSQESDH